ncbi:MAG TPA: hypothetical protein VG867_02625 [Rhizomicrobium sp.]|nr:hypothetical protein [Rhizomicrobium sp.]
MASSIYGHTDGNGNGNIFVNSCGSTVAVGSASGQTILAGYDVNVTASGYNAQVGYSGTGGGEIDVLATHALNLFASAANVMARIGNGYTGNGGAGSGNINIKAGDVDIETENTGSVVVIGNAGSTSVTGDINVTATGTLTLDETATNSSAIIGNGDFSLSTTGAVGGNITVTAGTIDLYGGNETTNTTQSRIGNRGLASVSGNIDVETTSGDLTIEAWDLDLASIGNGVGAIDGANLVTGSASGNIKVVSAGALYITANDAGQARISAGYAPNTSINVTAAGAISLSAVDVSAGLNGIAMIGNFGNNIGNAVGGNITVTSTTSSIELSASETDSFVGIGNDNGLSTTGGNIVVSATNSTNGHVLLSAAGDGSFVQIGNGSPGGTVSGNIAVHAGSYITVDAAGSLDAGNLSAIAQIGNGGYYDANYTAANISGVLNITAGGDLNLEADQEEGIAQIGNGDPLWGRAGNTSGDMALTINGSLNISGSGTDWIGNTANTTASAKETGNVTIIVGNWDLAGSDFLASDLGSVSGTGGNVFVGFTPADSSNVTVPINLDWGDFISPNTLTFASTGGLDIQADVMNSGTGKVNVIAGWDGSTTSLSSLTSADVANATVYGNHNGSVTIEGLVAVGAASGKTTVAGYNVVVDGTDGYAQIGYWGGGGGNISVMAKHDVILTGGEGFAQIGNNGDSADTGNIAVVALGNVTLTGGEGYAQIGNGGGWLTGSATGNISVTAGGDIDLYADTAWGTGYVQIGNGGSEFDGTANGSINVKASYVELDGGWGTSYAQIGNGGANVTYGTSGNIVVNVSGAIGIYGGDGDYAYGQIGNGGYFPGSDPSGNITVKATGDITLLGGDGENAYVQIGNGGVQTGADTNGTIKVTSGGNISLIAGSSDGEYDYAQIGNGGDSSTGVNSGDITVNATGSILLQGEGDYAQIGNGGYGANSSSGNITVIAGADLTLDNSYGFYYAQIGNGGFYANGTDNGNIKVSVGGDLYLTGGEGYVQIGNGGLANVTGNVSGNIAVTVCGTTVIETQEEGGPVWIGNFTSNGTESGDVVVITGDYDAENDYYDTIGDFASADILGGNVTLGTTNASFDYKIDNGANYSSPYSLSVLSAGDLLISGNLQNSGSGNITLVAGWNPNVAPANVSTTAGAYGNNNAVITIGGASAAGNAAVGSKGGTTTVLTDLLDVDSENGYAQVGYHGTGGGDIVVSALGAIAITANDVYSAAQIGNGGINVTGKITGNISVTSKSGGIVVTTLADGSVASIGNMGGLNSSQSGNITVNTNGGALALVADNPGIDAFSFARIGNFATDDTTGKSTGDIVINAGAMSLEASGGASFAEIGDGSFHTGNNTGAVSGNITINAKSLALIAEAGSGDIDQARIGDLGSGAVTGDVTVNTTGNISILADYGNVASIGSVSAPLDSHGNVVQGHGSGNLTVISGKNISLIGENGGIARIESGGFTSGNISVTAAKNILLQADSGPSTTGGSTALIGAFIVGNGTVNVTVTSTGGSIDLEANDPGSTAEIGNLANSLSGALGGNITVSAANTAHGAIVLNATGSNATAAIGNDAQGLADSISGNISIASGGNVTLNASGAGSATGIGNRGGTAGSAKGNITVAAGGEVALDSITGASSLIGNTATGSHSGNVIVTAQAVDGIRDSIVNDIAGGNFTLLSLGSGTIEIDDGASYSSSYDLTIDAGGNILVEDSLQNAGTGDITLVSGGSVTIGGSGASGGVAIGSKKGVTTIAADNLILSASHGYAQLGYHGGGSGDIVAAISGNITLNGGGSTGYYAQIGDGGYKVSGSSNAAITVAAGGAIALNGGSGQEAYAQIGHGGAESNTNSSGYSETGLVTVTGESVEMNAGSGNASYAQIGHGGYKSGQSLNGTATIGGDIVITAVSFIRLNGNGTDAYAQIGNGGDFVNTLSANGSGGTISGNITAAVTAPTGSGDPITLTAGSGANSYAQIGNGGQGENTPVSGAAVNFTVSGDVLVSDITLTGSNTGTNGYSQIGNGDASKTGTGNVSGNVTLGQGTKLTTIDGKAPGASADFGNVTGNGTVSGTVPSSGANDPATIGSIASITNNQVSNPNTYSVTTVTVTPVNSESYQFGTETVSEGPTPLEKLSDSSDSEGLQPADTVAQSVGQSLEGGKKVYVTSQSIIPGVLKQYITLTGNNPHGVPPADEDYSSWGNEALWRW